MITIYSEWVKPTVQIGLLFPRFHWFCCRLTLTCSFLQVLTDHPASAWTSRVQRQHYSGLPQLYLDLEQFLELQPTTLLFPQSGKARVFQKSAPGPALPVS